LLSGHVLSRGTLIHENLLPGHVLSSRTQIHRKTKRHK
jgi:hypothetical protein